MLTSSRYHIRMRFPLFKISTTNRSGAWSSYGQGRCQVRDTWILRSEYHLSFLMLDPLGLMFLPEIWSWVAHSVATAVEQIEIHSAVGLRMMGYE